MKNPTENSQLNQPATELTTLGTPELCMNVELSDEELLGVVGGFIIESDEKVRVELVAERIRGLGIFLNEDLSSYY